MKFISASLWELTLCGLKSLEEMSRWVTITEERLEYIKIQLYTIFVSFLDIISEQVEQNYDTKKHSQFITNLKMISKKIIEMENEHAFSDTIQGIENMVNPFVLTEDVFQEKDLENFPCFDERADYFRYKLKDVNEILRKLPDSNTTFSIVDIPQQDAEKIRTHLSEKEKELTCYLDKCEQLKKFIQKYHRNPHFNIDSERDLFNFYFEQREKYLSHLLSFKCLVKLFPILK